MVGEGEGGEEGEGVEGRVWRGGEGGEGWVGRVWVDVWVERGGWSTTVLTGSGMLEQNHELRMIPGM